MLIIKYENPPPEKKIVNFDQILLKEEGSGILNWALEGAAKLLQSNGAIAKSSEQKARVDVLLKSSRPFDVFGELFIHPTSMASITTEEVVAMFIKFCKKMSWTPLPERKVQHLFHEYMQACGAVKRTDIKRNGHNKRGYVGFKIREK